MLTLKTQILLIIIFLLVLAVLINMVKKRLLELKYVLIWMACDIALIVLVCFPHLMEKMAKALGIYSTVNMIFFLGFIFSLFIIFSLTVALSRVTEKVRRLAQIVAMLPKEILKDHIEN